MGFKKLGVLFLLLSVQLLPLLALSQTSSPDPFTTTDLNQESVPKRLVKLGEKQNIAVINKRGGGGGGHAGGGGRGSAGGGKGRGGGKRSPAVVIPLYAAGGANHPRNSHSHHSDGSTLNYVFLDNLIVVFFASFFLVLF